jgi:pre-rRNA-processing protein TSR1
MGFRRFVVHPLYSHNSRGGKGTNNVHRFERFLQQGRTSVATVYGPIVFGNMPILLYKDTGNVNGKSKNLLLIMILMHVDMLSLYLGQ